MQRVSRFLLVTLIAVSVGGCNSDVDDSTKRFDAVFWNIWFMEMTEADRKAVCWEPPEESAKTYASGLKGEYLSAEERAEKLFAIACESYYE